MHSILLNSIKCKLEWAEQESNLRCFFRNGFTVRPLRHSGHLPLFKLISHHQNHMKYLFSYPDSNRNQPVRSRLFYPLNYRRHICFDGLSILQQVLLVIQPVVYKKERYFTPFHFLNAFTEFASSFPLRVLQINSKLFLYCFFFPYFQLDDNTFFVALLLSAISYN